VCLVAQHLEANGIPTVIAGSARDIVDYCGAPRFLFTDFPLGNPCGKPYDSEMQQSIVDAAFDLLESATVPRTMQQTRYRWSSDDRWRDDYLRVDPAQREALLQLGTRRRARQREQKQDGDDTED
jgi:D-proline reductase (dithiol) PrdB